MAESKLGVFILSYQRPQFIHEAIESILAQDYDDFKLMISENSPDDSVFKTLAKYESDQRVQLIKRNKSLPSLDHFNQILKDASSFEYFMMFHDDDIMRPGCLSKMVEALDSDTDLSAVACNAFDLLETKQTTVLYNPNLTADKIIKNPSDLAKSYLTKKIGHVPFPSYMYRSESTEGILLDSNEGGKHADVTFLMKVLNAGPMLWIHQPLINYRKHAANDSIKIDMNSIRSLTKFMRTNAPSLKFSILIYEIKNFIRSLR